MPDVARAAAWLRAGRGGLFTLAMLTEPSRAGPGVAAFQYLISFFTRLATGSPCPRHCASCAV